MLGPTPTTGSSQSTEMGGETEPAEHSANGSSGSGSSGSSGSTALDPPQQQPADDPDLTEDEMDGDSGLGHSAEATAEAEEAGGGGAEEQSTAASIGAARRAAPRKRKRSQGWTGSKKKKNHITWQERKAMMAARAAAAQNEAHNKAAAGLPPLADEPAEAAAETAAEPAVKLEQTDETMEEQGSSSPAKAADEVVEKTERGRPLRASIKARQKQLEEERRLEEEGRKRRREEKLLALARSKARVKKEEPATPTTTQPLSLSAQSPPLSSLSSLPSYTSSSSHPPRPPPLPALQSVERDKSRVVPSHCYGVDWRCVAKLTDCIYTQLHAARSSVIDWSVVSAMMANVCPLSADECRLLWRSVAYGMDDDGYGRWKRLDPDYEDEADSDIDVELPGYDETGVADIRTIVKSSQLRQCAKEDTMDDWTTQHDRALLHVLATWTSRSKQQLHATTTAPTTTPRISLSLTSPPLSAAASPHLPSVAADWQYIADLFQQFATVHKSPTFLQARLAALTRTALTVDGTRGSGEEERALMRESVLAVLGVGEGVEGRDWLLHSGGRNWDEKREVVDRRLRLRRQQRTDGSGAASGEKRAAVSRQRASETAAVPTETKEDGRSEAPQAVAAAAASGATDDIASSPRHVVTSDSMQVATEEAANTASNDMEAEQVAAETGIEHQHVNSAGNAADPPQITETTAIAVQ